MSDAYNRVGRGGAGNFWSQKDIEEAANQEEKFAETPVKDLEAQKIPGIIATDSSPPPDFVRTGRGGAGNFVPPSELSSESKELAKASKGGAPPTRKTGVAFSQGHSGRGGAGNFKQVADEEEKKRAEEEEILRARMEAKIRLDVESMMKPPPKAHAVPESYDDNVI